jgi:transposase
MAYVEHGMWEILEVLKRHHGGESQRRIASATGRSRKTVRRYIETARWLGWSEETAPDEALASRVLQQRKPGPSPNEASPAEKELRPHHYRIQQWLEGVEGEKGLKLTKVHELLTRHGVEVSYSTLYRYAAEHFGWARPKLTLRRAEVAPGELAEVDFGRLGKMYDSQTGRNRYVWALLVTLGFSRYQCVHVSFSQKLNVLIDGLEQAWEFFGGVPERVVIDNMRAAVVKADRYEPTFQRVMGEYAEHRGFVIDPAVARHPEGKPIVERAVPYVRESFFRGEQWLDLEHVQRAARHWCQEVAGRRVHGTTRQRPLVVFEQSEQSCLRPLSGARFDTPQWAEPKVHPDHHVQFLKALYSVPTRYVGKKVTVRGDQALVRIYYKGELIKTHPRKPPGGRQTDYSDYPQELETYARRDPERIVRRARLVGPNTGRFMSLLLSGTFPWAKLRQAQKLMRLSDKYGRARVETACQRALAFELINVQKVERMLKSALAPSADSQTRTLVQMPLRFLRPNDSFSHQPQRKDNLDGDQTLTQVDSETAQALGDPPDAAGEDRLRSESKNT